MKARFLYNSSMSCCNYKILSIEQTFVNFSSSATDIGTKVSLVIFWNKKYNVTVNGFSDTVKQYGSGK